MNVAFLGPNGTHSHEAARGHYQGAQESCCPSMQAVIDSVSSGAVDFGCVPLFNTYQQGIADAHQAFASRINSVFIIELFSHDVRHFMYTFGAVNQIYVISSHRVVFPQISNWCETNTPKAEQRHCTSTAVAIKEAAEANDKSHGAVGAYLASEFYGIPRLENPIHNDLNRTLFATIRKSNPLPSNFTSSLWLGTNVSRADRMLFLQKAACRNLRVLFTDATPPRNADESEITIFEVDAEVLPHDTKPSFNPSPFVREISSSLKNVHFIGGCSGMSLASFATQNQR